MWKSMTMEVNGLETYEVYKTAYCLFWFSQLIETFSH
jgi:hypothetical protein